MNCIRCGRASENGEWFCPECEEALAAELPELQHDTPIVLPTRAPKAPKPEKKKPKAQPAQKTEKKAAPPKKTAAPQEIRPTRANRRRNAALIALGALLCLTLAALVYFYCNYYQNILVQKNQLRKREDAIAAQEAENLAQREELAQTLEALADANKTLDRMEREAKELQDKLSTLEQDGKTAEAEQEALQKAYDELLAERDQLKESLTAATEQQGTMQSENASLTARITALLSEIAGLKSKNSSLQTTTEFFKSSVCFVGYNDRHYHCYGCSALDLTGTWKVYRIYAAQAAGYTACSVCGG